jgi:hypothetical protein
MRNFLDKFDSLFMNPKVSDFSPFGEKECEGKCDRIIIKTKEGPVIACKGCSRIVMDSRK